MARTLLTVTSRKAHSGTRVPDGMPCENLSSSIREERMGKWKETNVPGASTLTQRSENDFHLLSSQRSVRAQGREH